MSTELAMTDLDSLRGFERFYRAHSGFVRTLLLHLGVAGATLDDAHQEVFLTAFRRRDAFRRDLPARPWLVGIARRVAFRHRRTQARSLRKLAAIALGSPSRPDAAAQLEARIFLERFIAALDPRRREIFFLSEIEGRTGPEIAEALGIHLDAAYSRLRQTRAALTRALARLEAQPDTAARVRHGFALLLPHLSGAGGWTGAWLAAIVAHSKVALVFVGLVAAVGLVATVAPVRRGAADEGGVAPPETRAQGPGFRKRSTARPSSTGVALDEAVTSTALAGAAAPVEPGGAAALVAPDGAATPRVPGYAAPPIAPGGPASALPRPADTSARRMNGSPRATDDLAAEPRSTGAATRSGALDGADTPSLAGDAEARALPTEPDALVALADLGDEARRLAEVRRLLDAGQPAAALARLQAGAGASATESLAEAEEALRVEGLCALGEREAARAAAAVLLRRRPGSSIARSAAESCPLIAP